MDKAMKDALFDRPAPVVVKELEWSQNAPQDARSQWVHIEDIDRCYEVEPTSCGAFEAETKCFPHGSYDAVWPLGRHYTLEAAKAACQADYTRRILSAVNAVSADQVLIDRSAPAVDRYVESRLEKQREADAFHMGIDRPAPVVDEQAIDDELNELACIGWSDSAMEPNEVAVAKAKDAILSAVNAVSEAQVRADERDWLAALFESGALTEENSIQHDVPGVIRAQDDAARIAFRRAQEGGK